MKSTRIAPKNEVLIFIASIILFVYFTFLFLNAYLLKLDYVVIGVFQEIFTIPFMLLALLLLIFSVRNFMVNRYTVNSYAFFSTILLVLVVFVTCVSFFM